MSKSKRVFQTSQDVQIHMEIHGEPSPSRPSLIFHHYYGGSPDTFKCLLSQQPLNSYHIILYHARGWSPSTGPSDPGAYGIRDMSQDLASVLVENGMLNHEGGFVLVGHSMGGKVVQHYAATTCPLALKGLVLIAPAPLCGIHLPPDVKRQQRIAYQAVDGVRFVLDHVLTGRPGTIDEETVEQCVRDSMRGNELATRSWPEYGAGEDFAHLQKEIRVPVLVLRGDRDFERDIVGQLGRELGWVQRTVRECGHLIPLEQPELLRDEIVQFLGGL